MLMHYSHGVKLYKSSIVLIYVPTDFSSWRSVWLMSDVSNRAIMASNESFLMLNNTSNTDDQRTVTEPILVLFGSGSGASYGSGSGPGVENSNTTEITEDYVYDYDFNSSFNNYDWAELIPAVVVYSFVLLLGISGNGSFDN